jgi:hypothetical protein
MGRRLSVGRNKVANDGVGYALSSWEIPDTSLHTTG